MRNHWSALYVDGLCLGVLYFQTASDASPAKGDGAGPRNGHEDKAQRLTDRQRFRRAVRLLRLIADDVREGVLAEARRENLEVLSRQVTAITKNDISVQVPAFHQ